MPGLRAGGWRLELPQPAQWLLLAHPASDCVVGLKRTRPDVFWWQR